MASDGDQCAAERTAGRGGLRILHVMRAPVGGLFRHVVDLTRAQAKAGHEVGIVADSTTGGDAAEGIFAQLRPSLALGLERLPMRRLPHPDDLRVAWRVASLLRRCEPDVLHGHGAKGGLYTRLPALLPGFPQPKRPLVRVYTPHGGSLHFPPDTPVGRVFFAAERMMAGVTDLIPFESDYARRRFVETIAAPPGLARVVHNGLAEGEFAPAETDADADDFLFVGEMRIAKGVEDLLRAFASLPSGPRLSLVGSGQDEPLFRDLAQRLGVGDRVAFLPPMPGARAFRRGRILVAPSRAESLPYIVLEAIAARLPIVATNVGGVPEIFGARADRLVPPRNVAALAAAMREMREMDPQARTALADEMARFVRDGFTIDLMSEGVLRGYREALANARARPYVSAARAPTGE